MRKTTRTYAEHTWDSENAYAVGTQHPSGAFTKLVIDRKYTGGKIEFSAQEIEFLKEVFADIQEEEDVR